MPEVHEEIQQQQIEAEQAEAAEACAMTSKYAKGALRRSYFWGVFGFIVPVALGFLWEYASRNGVDAELNPFLEPIFWGVTVASSYLLWSMFWGILIVHRPVKNFYSRFIKRIDV